MEGSCTMTYRHMDGGLNFDNTLDLGIKLRNARDSVKNKYNEGLSRSLIYLTNSHDFIVDFSSSDLVGPLTDFIDLAGTPYFVDISSDYESVEKVLKNYKKKLDWSLGDFLMGKHVVDDKPPQPGIFRNIMDVLTGNGGLGF